MIEYASGKVLTRSRAITLKLPRRHFFHLAAGAAVSRIASAIIRPRPVSIIIGFARAGGTDPAARLILDWSNAN
jgi:tripartite-type tricarboxylate transporter receptor subunit TctC